MVRYSLWLVLAGVVACFTISATWNSNMTSQPAAARWETIAGRNASEMQEERFLLYRALVPLHWQRSNPLADQSIENTTEPLCTFTISEETGPIRLTIHNFPYDTIAERVPPSAQIMRWQQQLQPLDPLYTQVTPVHGGGFTGLHLQARGNIDSQTKAILAWSMQLAPEYFHAIMAKEGPYNRHFCRERRADYTIKAMGSPASIATHREQITAFASSFELIHELP